MLTLDPEKIPLQPGETVVDLGCGEGRHALGLYFLHNHTAVHFIALDLNLRDLETAAERQREFTSANTCANLTFIHGNGFDLPFANHSIDHLICSEVLEHIVDYHLVLDEIYRVLKPGGTLCISVPRAWPEKICWLLENAYYQVEGGHVRIFNGRKLKQQILHYGYEFTHHHWAHALHVPYWWLRCLFWNRGDAFFPVRLYHRFLLWDLFQKPWLTRALDRLLNPVMGKSLVFYFRKP